MINLREIDHFVITEFSVLHGTTGSLPSEEWLQRRWPIFERFCLASVTRQTCQDFRWIISVSPENPSWVREALEGLGLPNLLIMTTSESPSAMHYADWLRQHLRSDRVLTSRLDSDDALGLDFVSRLHSAVLERPEGAFNFSRGLQLTPMGLMRVSWKNGPFVSLLESAENVNFGTVLKYQHDYIGNFVQVHQVPGPAAWMQVVHGGNIGNRTAGVPAFGIYNRSQFPMMPDIEKFNLRGYWNEVQPVRRLMSKVSHALAGTKSASTPNSQ